MDKLRPSHLGSALLTALFIMALIAIVATAMSQRIMGEIYRTRLIATSSHLFTARDLATFWAMDALSKRTLALKLIGEKGLVLKMPKEATVLTTPIQIEASLYDLQARLNINNLQQKPWHVPFARLLSRLRNVKDETQALSLSENMRKWLIPLRIDMGEDDYEAHYLGRTPSIHPGHQSFVSESELRVVKGMTRSIYQALRPYVTVLPTPTKINLNTAPIEVIQSLTTKRKLGPLKLLLKQRTKEAIRHIEMLDGMLKALYIPKDFVGVDSEYYLLETTLYQGEHHMKVYTVLRRVVSGKGRVGVRLIRQSINTI